MKFFVDGEQAEKIHIWLKETVYPEVIAKQKKQIKNPDLIVRQCWEDGFPYAGAIGGGLTYCFTPTSLGDVLIVRYGDEYELNVTDYESW